VYWHRIAYSQYSVLMVPLRIYSLTPDTTGTISKSAGSYFRQWVCSEYLLSRRYKRSERKLIRWICLPCGTGMYRVDHRVVQVQQSVCSVCACVRVQTITFERNDLWRKYLTRCFNLTVSTKNRRSQPWIKVQGHENWKTIRPCGTKTDLD